MGKFRNRGIIGELYEGSGPWKGRKGDVRTSASISTHVATSGNPFDVHPLVVFVRLVRRLCAAESSVRPNNGTGLNAGNYICGRESAECLEFSSKRGHLESRWSVEDEI